MTSFDRFFNNVFDELESWWPSPVYYRPQLTQGPSTGVSRSLVPSEFPLSRSSIGRIRTDFVDKKDHYEMTCELPGVPKDAVRISYEGNTLYLEAEKKEEKRDEQDNSIVTERSYGLYKRSFTVPDDCDLDSRKEQKFEDGVLRLAFSKREPSASRKQIEL